MMGFVYCGGIMDYKIIALDIDGTLVNSHKVITEKTKNTLLNIQECGVKVAIASGRPYAGVKRYVDELELARYGGYVISYNGGQLVRASDGKALFEKTFSDNLAHRLYDFSRKHKTGIMTYTKDGNLVVTEDNDDKYIVLEAGINGIPVKKLSSWKDYIDYPVLKCILTEEGDYLERLEHLLAEEFKGELNIFRSEPFFLEALPLAVDKSTALKALTEVTDIKREEIIACGDGFNDITMVQYAGLGVAMRNAQQSVKDAADFITLSNDEDGIVNVINRFILEK